jgi:hypothetical protein
MADSTTVYDGSRRLVCAPRTPWDPEDDPGNYQFNAITYQSTMMEEWDNSAAIDYGNIGLNDRSVECWMRYFPDGDNWYRSEATPVGFNSVFCGWFNGPPLGQNIFGLGFDGLLASASFGYGRNPPTTTYQVTGTAPDDGDWHHWCMVCDRSGLMTFYIDGVSLGTTDISAEGANNIASGNRYYIGTLRALNMVGGTARCMGIIGSAAFHNEVLTVAEIKDSVMGRRTQLVTNTVCRYDYRITYRLNPDRLAFYDPDTSGDYTPTGWTRDVRRTNFPVAAPSPYIVLQDLSGNGFDAGLRCSTPNHWVTYDPSWK